MHALRHTFIAVLIAAAAASFAAVAAAQPAPVAKTNPMKVYMHYMPWFETPATTGNPNDWAYHWEFRNRNPNNVNANGRRQIASHYYPKIGPYASRDPHVIEYHLLLMKYAGVDGVLIDWYGVDGTNGDVDSLLINSNAIVDHVDDFGLKFGVVLEDRFSRDSDDEDNPPDIDIGKANVAYLKNNYFNNPQYIRQNAGADPLLAVFGPITFTTQAQWTQILAEAGEPVDFLTLWYQNGKAGSNADGEYAWIYQDAQRTHLQHQSDYYQHRTPTLGTAGGVAYPGFNDYYQEGGTNTVIGFEIPHNNGATLDAVLNLAGQNAAKIDFLQLATWNDFGEGTMFEPTVETGFNYLVRLQQFTGAPYSQSELELVYRLYRARKSHVNDAAVQTQLDDAASRLAALEVAAARAILDAIDPPGDFNGDGVADGADMLLWQRTIGATGLYPLMQKPADGNADGVVDKADLELWKQGTALPPASANSLPVPEPHGAALALLALLFRVPLAAASAEVRAR